MERRKRKSTAQPGIIPTRYMEHALQADEEGSKDISEWSLLEGPSCVGQNLLNGCLFGECDPALQSNAGMDKSNVCYTSYTDMVIQKGSYCDSDVIKAIYATDMHSHTNRYDAHHRWKRKAAHAVAMFFFLVCFALLVATEADTTYPSSVV